VGRARWRQLRGTPSRCLGAAIRCPGAAATGAPGRYRYLGRGGFGIRPVRGIGPFGAWSDWGRALSR